MVKPSSGELREYLAFATAIAQEAGASTLQHFRAGVEVETKADDSPVTIADREAEELIRDRIADAWPSHGVIGEEFPETGSGSAFRWYVDPIDGTKMFVRGVPLYGVLIGLEVDGNVEAGVAHFPAVGDTVAAASGLGATLNGRPARVSQASSLSQGTVLFGDLANIEEYGRAEAFDRLQKAAGFRAGWSDAYGHALVATGRAELMLDPIMNPWDCGPFPVILREAGGWFGDWQGEEGMHGGEALSTSRALLDEVLGLIGGRA